MQTPFEIDFQHMPADPRIRERIAGRIAELEQFFGRITACRVVLKGAGGHHRTGGPYEVRIHLALPDGKAVDVGRVPQKDERHAEIGFAINDAFRRARRNLQDKVRLMRGAVKDHAGQPVGTITRIDPSGEFGFLRLSDDREVYFHRNSVLNGGFKRLAVGSRVAIAEKMGEKGPQASTVRLLGKHRLRP